MTTMTANPPDYLRSVRRFLHTPKGILIMLFAVTGALAVWGESSERALPGLLVAMGVAAAIDVVAAKLHRDTWIFPSGALLTGAIVAFVLSPFESLVVVGATTTLAITSKHLFRTRLANIFNPAAFALVASALLFGSVDSWWGAMPAIGPAGVAIILASGLFIADRINKLPLVLTFLGLYFGLFTLASIAGDAATIAEVYRAPVLHAVLFFAFFMADDPPTCPVKYGEQVIFAVIVAATSFVFFEQFHWIYYLPAALLVGNAFEAVRKVQRRRKRRPAVVRMRTA